MERKKVSKRVESQKKIRSELESAIRAVNDPLKEAVKTMNWIELLNNVHPNERTTFAWKLYKAGALSRKVLMEKYPKRD